MSTSPYIAMRVAEVRPEGTVGVTLCLEGAMLVQPGQFLMVWLPHIDERPFSVMDDAPLALTIADIGPFTQALCRLTPGDRVWLRGPYGTAYPEPTRSLLLVGGGSGIASLALLAKRALAQKLDVTAVIGARTAHALMLVEHLTTLGCQVHVATDDGSRGRRGTVVDLLETLPSFARDTCVCACGPEPMLRAVAAWSRSVELDYWVSMERLMKCGFGVCGACHAGDRLVCQDGPVFCGAAFERIAALGPMGDASASGGIT